MIIFAKRGQLSLYLIIFFIIMISILFFMVYDVPEKDMQIFDSNFQFTPIENYIDDCLKQSAYESIQLIELQGGYYRIADEHMIISKTYYKNDNITLRWIDVPYYINGNKIKVPSLSEIQINLKYAVDDELDRCLNNLSVFREQGFTIENTEFETNITIEDDRILIEMDYPIIVRYKDSEKSLDKFIVRQDSRLKDLHLTSKEIIQAQGNITNLICISCIAEIADKNMHLVTFTPFSTNDTILVSITDIVPSPDVYQFLYKGSK